MKKIEPQPPVLVLGDSLEEQARLTSLLAPDYDEIISCQFAQLDPILARAKSASVVVGWKQPDAELRSIVDTCRIHKSPLLVVLKQFSSNDINRLPEKADYVLLPSQPDLMLKPWLEHAQTARSSMLAMEQEITALTSKLDDRKVIEKAKGLLMKIHSVDEQSAYRALQKSAMKSSLSLAQVAKNLLVTMETLN